MGFFSSKKYTKITPNLSFYYPQKKLSYGKSKSVKKYYFDQLITKSMVTNKYEGKTQLENMMSLIGTMNFCHTPAFVPYRTKYCGYLQKKTIKVDIEEFKKIFPDIKEVLSTTETNSFLEKKVILSLALKEYDFDYDKFTFIKDGIIYLVDLDKYKAYAIHRVPKTNYNTNIFNYPRLLEPPLEPYELDLKKDLNIDLDIDNVLEEVVLKPLRANLKEKYNIDYYDASKEVGEEQLHIDIIDKEKNFTTIQVSAEYTWIGMMKTKEEIQKELWDSLSNNNHLSENIFKSFQNTIKEIFSTPLEQHDREFRMKYYKYAQSMITIKVPTYLITYLQRKEKNPNEIYIEYKNTLGVKKLAYIADKYTVTSKKMVERLSAVYHIKGDGVPNGTKKLGVKEPKEHKYWRLALERAKYKKRWKLKYSKKEKEDKDIIEQLNDNENTKYAEIYHCVNLLGATIKANRSNRFYVQYLKAVLKYFDKLCDGFKPYNEMEPVYGVRELTEAEKAVYERSGTLPNGAYLLGYKTVTIKGEHRTRYEYRPIYGVNYLKYYRTKFKTFNTPLSAKEDKNRPNIAFRIAGIKRYVADKTFTKECFTGVEPNASGLYLYVNVKDFSKSTVEEQNQGIYHGYIQYGLNLSIFFEEYNSINKKLKLAGITIFAGSTTYYSFSDPSPIMFRLDIKKYEKENGHQWFNDGNMTINASAFEYTNTKIIEDNSGEHEHTTQKMSGWKKKFEYDDRCDFNPLSKPEYLIKFTAYLPLMPIKLWYRIPLSAKKEITHSTILIYSYTSIEIKKRGTFSSLLSGIGLVALGALGGPIGFALSTLSAMAMGGIFKGKMTLAINLASAIYGAYLGTTGGLEKGGIWGNLQTVGSVVGGTSGVFSAVNNYNMQNMANQFNSTMNDLANQHKSEADKLLEKELKGNRINLTDYDVNTNYDETIEWLYYVAYGNVLYNDFYNKQAYNSKFKIYNEYDRFK